MKKLILLMLLLAGYANGATYYVSKTGLDSHTCSTTDSAGTNKLTIAAGIGCLSAGDTLQIHTGTYNESINDLIPNGTLGSPTIIKSYSGETVTLSPSTTVNRVINVEYGRHDITVDGLIIDGTNATYQVIQLNGETFGGGQGVIRFTIKNSEIKNGGGVGILSGPNSQGTVIQNNNIHHNIYKPPNDPAPGAHGLYISGNDCIIEDNLVHDNDRHGLQIYSYYFTNGIRPSRNIIRRNKFYNNGTGTAPNPPSDGAGIVVQGYDNQIYNNLVYRQPGGIQLFGGANNLVYNNTIFKNDQGASLGAAYGIYIKTGTSNNALKNNILWQNTTTIYIESGANGTICSNNLGMSSCTSGTAVNPLFTNESTNDFTLQGGSPAIDAGTDLSTVFTTDYLGNTRPQGLAWDEGAYERLSSAGDTLTLFNPNGGTLGQTGTTQTFTWGSTGSIANVKLEYDAGNDGTFEGSLYASTPNDGSQTFTAPAAGTTYRFRVCDTDGSPCAVSASNVTITSGAGGSFTKIFSDNTTGSYIGDITGTSDVHMEWGAPTTNKGSTPYLYINKFASGDHSHALLRFDGLSQIPSNATISSVTLRLYLEAANSGSHTLDIRRLLQPFVESQATWSVRSTGNNWTTAGALSDGNDRVATASAQLTSVGPALQFYSVTDSVCASGGLCDDVRQIVNLSRSNLGWHISRNGTGEDGTYHSFTSKEGTNGNRPNLSVSYSVPNPSITVIQPTAVSHLFPNDSTAIRWTTQAISGNIKAEISRNNGVTYDPTPIIASYPYDQADAVWTVSGPSCNQCVIKLTSLNDTSVTAVSPAFKIAGLRTGLR